MNMWHVYLIENFEGRIYIGYTGNLEQRLKDHNLRDGSHWTHGKGEWKLFYSESFFTKKEAIKRERKLKSLKAGQKIKDILNINNVPL